MGWRNPPATWPTMPPSTGKPNEGSALSASIRRRAGAPAQIAKRSQGRRERPGTVSSAMSTPLPAPATVPAHRNTPPQGTGSQP